MPVIYDNIHNEILNFDGGKSDHYWINKVNSTWGDKGGR